VTSINAVKETFVCNTCGETLPIDIKVGGKDNKCKPCRREYDKKRRKELKEKKLQAGILQKEPIPIQNMGENAKEEIKEEPKKEDKNATAKEIKQIKEMTSGLLVAVFGLVSTRAGSHWAITEDEAKTVSNPLINILNKYDLFKKISKNVDSLALLAATATIIVPRSLMTIEQRKENKKHGKSGTIKPGTNDKTRPEDKQERKNKNDSNGTSANGDIPDSYILAASGKSQFQPTTDY
jgi:hypothetical protein